jgi:hypothetical protein
LHFNHSAQNLRTLIKFQFTLFKAIFYEGKCRGFVIVAAIFLYTKERVFKRIFKGEKPDLDWERLFEIPLLIALRCGG